MNTEVNAIEKGSTIPKPEKKHIGNAKLSASKRAIKIHIFETGKFYVIPLAEIQEKESGKIYEYIDEEPEIVGEIEPPKNGSKFFKLSIKTNFYYLKATYIQMLSKGSSLTLMIQEQ